jgi:hypothetical protein
VAALAMHFLGLDAAAELVAALVHLLLLRLARVLRILVQRLLLLVAHGGLLPWSYEFVLARVSRA